ncbi:MAG: hypothetical protein NG747_16380 [Candidatus Brocadia sp.]|nr:hypothetical protein [Candidatus Brocadia sp.]
MVDTSETLSYFSKTKYTAMKACKEFVMKGIGERNNPMDDVIAGVLLGSEMFVA